MRNSIANYKESLTRITSDVLDEEEELDFAGSRSGQASPFADRRSSHRFAHSPSSRDSPLPNGIGPDHGSEIDHHKAEIERLQTSEAEIKALAINYAAILKEKEAQLSRLHEENSLLRKKMDAKSGVSVVSDENLKPSKNSLVLNKANQSPSKQHKNSTQVSPCSTSLNISQRNSISKVESFSNGGIHTAEGIPMTQSQKELEALLEEKNKTLAVIEDKFESEIKHLMTELRNEREISADLKLKFCEEQRRSCSYQKDIHDMKLENERAFAEIKVLQKKLAENISEISRLQAEISHLNTEKVSDETLRTLPTSIAVLQEEKDKLKLEKERLAAALEHAIKNSTTRVDDDHSEYLQNMEKTTNKEREDMLSSIQQLEKTLKATCKERDKAQKELARLKKHLLDKELEESEKMDEDSKIIEDLRAASEHQKSHILKLERAIRLELGKHEETTSSKSKEIQTLNEIIYDLNKKLENYMSMVESKNSELLNLQTALGQYYAESEAKERLERELAAAKEELVNLSYSLKVAKQDCEVITKERELVSSKLSQAERLSLENKRTIQKLQEDNSKLHRAVEQSITRINRMSMDSDFYVDRRIVIKLLVTYFQRNHSKEVLDLMVRMLGFSDEDKQRIGFAQQNAGKSTVRGVLGLPGRLVGGILGGKASVSSEVTSENQSFADLWVDFLLKETEQRERRDPQVVDQHPSMQEKGVIASSGSTGPSTPEKSSPSTSDLFIPSSAGQNQPLESDTEFATVPLTSMASTESTRRLSRWLQR